MPLTSKGSEIMEAMKKEYGGKEGEKVFYASRNKGTISGVDSTMALKAKFPAPSIRKKNDAEVKQDGIREDFLRQREHNEHERTHKQAVEEHRKREPNLIEKGGNYGGQPRDKDGKWD